MEYVVVVDQNDHVLGIEEKWLAHKKGSLHRAVSICLFDIQGRWLVQKRAVCKYHSPGLLANSCCSHPRLGESFQEAAMRRVFEELGIVVPLTSAGSFIYRAELANGLVEHELDHVFTGILENQKCILNPNEVSEVCLLTLDEIRKGLKEESHTFAPWFPFVVEHIALRSC